MIAPRKQRKVCSVPVSGAAVGVASVPVAQSVLPLSCVPGSGVCPYFPGMLCSPFGITSLRSPGARWGSGRSISPASVLTARSTHGVPGLSCLSRFSGALRAPRAAWECGCEFELWTGAGRLGQRGRAPGDLAVSSSVQADASALSLHSLQIPAQVCCSFFFKVIFPWKDSGLTLTQIQSSVHFLSGE